MPSHYQKIQPSRETLDAIRLWRRYHGDRPGRRTDIAQDIELVTVVREGKAQGKSVGVACEEFLKAKGVKGPHGQPISEQLVGSLKKRYERVASAYPDIGDPQVSRTEVARSLSRFLYESPVDRANAVATMTAYCWPARIRRILFAVGVVLPRRPPT